MAFGKKTTTPAKSVRIIQTAVAIATPDHHTEVEDKKTLQNLDTLLKNLSLGEMELLAKFISNPEYKASAINYMEMLST